MGYSTDEMTLLNMAAKSGFKMTKRLNDTIHLDISDHKEGITRSRVFKIVEKFEFSSERRRMSVIVEFELGFFNKSG